MYRSSKKKVKLSGKGNTGIANNPSLVVNKILQTSDDVVADVNIENKDFLTADDRIEFLPSETQSSEVSIDYLMNQQLIEIYQEHRSAYVYYSGIEKIQHLTLSVPNAMVVLMMAMVVLL